MANVVNGSKVTIRDVQSDVARVRDDVESLKHDVAAIKGDISVVKTDVSALRLDMTQQLSALTLDIKETFHNSQRETTREIDGMKGELGVIKVKAGLLGILAGSIPAGIAIITWFWK